MTKRLYMKDLPLISVVVPVYKVEAYLDKCVQSIVNQTYTNLEILLVDDGSPDNSGAICDAWAAKDSRVRVIHKENGGGGDARNRALEIARGERIAFVDSDDYIAPDMFQHLHELLEMGADIAECAYLETQDDFALFSEETGEITTHTVQEAMLGNIRDTVFRQLIWNKLYRAEMVGDIRFPVGTKIDDEYFTYRVLLNAKTLIRSRKVCYAYRQQGDSVMHQAFSLRRMEEGLRAKQQRLVCLQERMPELVYEAKFDLFFSCLFSMQGCLTALQGQELASAKQLLQELVNQVTPLEGNPAASKLRNILLKMAQRNFEATAKLLNLLIKLHVLT